MTILSSVVSDGSPTGSNMLPAMVQAGKDWLETDGDVKVSPAYEVVAQKMRRAIHLGELPAGSKLPPERTLAERMGVSRITLREAIRVLEGEGYVEVGRGRTGGTTVHSGSMTPAEVSTWMGKRWKDLEAIFDFRLANERSSAERAATRATSAQTKKLGEIAARCAESADVNEFRSWDVHFHLFIADLAESRLLRQAVEEARAELYVPFRAITLEEMLASAGPQHRAIVAAIADADPRRAAKAMEKHLAATTEQMGKLARKPRR